MRVLIAVDRDRGMPLVPGLRDEGVAVVGVIDAGTPAAAADDDALGAEGDEFFRAIGETDVLVLRAHRTTLTDAVVSLCDRRGVRIVALAADESESRLAESFGLLSTVPVDIDARRLADALGATAIAERTTAPARRPEGPRTIAVWGPHGAPGRSTIAIELAMELSRGGRRVGLVDADTHAPSLALALGVADEGPGFAAACRQAAFGTLDARELHRIATPLGRTGVEVLAGINRPSRWPELSEDRVSAALETCRDWVDHTVVDVAASLERDEEIMSDLEAPRRNGATLAALVSSDLVVAVVGADPVGVARFLRAYAELRAVVGSTPIVVVANRLRPGALGIDARGQVRRTLDRFGGIPDVHFVPADARSADAALLAAQPIAEVAPRSPLTLALRRLVGETILPPAPAERPAASRRARRRSRARMPAQATS